MKRHIFTLALCLAAFASQAQTEYRIEQPLPGNIKEVNVYDGWNVRLIRDTFNLISIATPCEYYFTEGNEPEICKLDAHGWLDIWKNTSMPRGTVVELHYQKPFQKLTVQAGANVSADTLPIFDYDGAYGYICSIDVNHGGSLSVGYIDCDWPLHIDVDSAATLLIGTVKAKRLYLFSKPGSTLLLDSINANEVKYYRDPTTHDNLWASDTARHIKVKTANRWFGYGWKTLRNTIDVAVNTPFTPVSLQYNNPYFSNLELEVIIGLKTNIIPMSKRWGLSLGLDFGMPLVNLNNNSTVNGRVLEIDTASPGVNRQSFMYYYYLGLPVRLHYRPQGAFSQAFFGDIHLGLEPRWSFVQLYFGSILKENAKLWEMHSNKVSIYNPVQLRADIGLKGNMFTNIEFNFYVDLLPTYRRETGMGNIHAFGFQMRF